MGYTSVIREVVQLCRGSNDPPRVELRRIFDKHAKIGSRIAAEIREICPEFPEVKP